MKFILPFTFVFKQPGWFTNLALLTVCQFIPIVGPIVLLGYLAELSLILEYDPDLIQHPRFDFDRFGKYLSRGIWPFLISLVMMLPIIPIMIGIVVISLVLDPPGPNNPPVLLFAALSAAEILVVFPIMLLSVPMTLHAKLTGRFDLFGAFRFGWDFLMRVGFLMIGAGIVYTFLAMFVMLLGLLLCFVGLYPAQSLIVMANQHLTVQLYLIYLDRGGEPLTEFGRGKRLDYDEEDETEEDLEGTDW